VGRLVLGSGIREREYPHTTHTRTHQHYPAHAPGLPRYHDSPPRALRSGPLYPSHGFPSRPPACVADCPPLDAVACDVAPCPAAASPHPPPLAQDPHPAALPRLPGVRYPQYRCYPGSRPPRGTRRTWVRPGPWGRRRRCCPGTHHSQGPRRTQAAALPAVDHSICEGEGRGARHPADAATTPPGAPAQPGARTADTQ
jgi:hypothetical protein